MKKYLTSTYTTRESTNGQGMFFYCNSCNNRMFNIDKNKMKYNGAECPRCKKILFLKKGK